MHVDTMKEILLKDADKISKLSNKTRQRNLNLHNKYEEKHPLDNKLIDALGGNVIIADLLNIGESTVSYYRRSGIPAGKLAELRILSLGVN